MNTDTPITKHDRPANWHPAPNKAQHSPQFGTKDGRPTLILGDNRSTDKKLKSAQAQIESDTQTIANIRAHADKLAEQLKKAQAWLVACSGEDYRGSRKAVAQGCGEALAAYEAAQ